MRQESWERFKETALHSRKDSLPAKGSKGSQGVLTALIVDSPWIPGFVGVSHLDYFLFPDQWVKANLLIEEAFPELIFLPGFWVEYGMAIEPSAFGCKITWWSDHPPSAHPMIHDPSEVSRLKVPHPREDGLMPFALNLYRHAEQRLRDHGHQIKMVAARGPLAIAAHLWGLTEFLVQLKLSPKETKALLETTAQTVILWLQAQMDCLSNVEGVMVLDDIVGLLSPADYMEFAHPYLERIFSSFPGMVKVYHNDSGINHILEPLAETGFHVLNFSHLLDIADVWKRVGGRICLMGNVPPLEALTEGHAQQPDLEVALPDGRGARPDSLRRRRRFSWDPCCECKSVD